MNHFVTIVGLTGIVIIVASLLSSSIERVGVPLVAALLVLGALLGPAGLDFVNMGLESPVLRTLATLALALVLFSDAVTIDVKDVRARWRLVWRMLGPGTLIPAALIALSGWLLLDISAPAAAILGAALASTDPVLLRSLLRSRVLPRDARVALRLESGMNDVILLPIVVLSMLVLRGGGAVAAADVGRSAVGLFLLGPVLGVLVGWWGIIMLVTVRERVGVRRDYESLYALGLALAAYAGAEIVGGSGFLAAFAAGLLVAAQDVELCDCFLEYGEATSEMLLLLTFVAFGTSLIWTGISAADGRTLLFALIALVLRTAVLFPVLAGADVGWRDRRLIALFGPRGLSSLLLVLLPVFAGLPGAEQLFRVVCLVVLISVVIHGGGIALWLRANSAPRAAGAESGSQPTMAPATDVPTAATPEAQLPDRIGIDELRSLWARGVPVTIVDARTERAWNADDIQAQGAVRISPDDPVRSARELKLSRNAMLVVYCA